MTTTTCDFVDSLEKLDVGRVQCDLLLKGAITPNRNCEFGLRHGFGTIANVREFQQAVPLCDYEDLRPAIDRMALGESNILVSEPVRRFFVTSGSAAKPKLVPVTSSFIRDKWRAFQAYWGIVRRDHPALASGKLIANFSDASAEQTTVGGGRCSSESSFWSAWSGSGCDTHSALSRDILNIRDSDARFYTIARMLLDTNVTGFMALNPSTIFRLFEAIANNRERLIEDVKRGGLSRGFEVESHIRQQLDKRLRGNTQKAGELRRALAGKDGGFRAIDIWPNLQVAISWRSPMLRAYLELLAPYLDPVPQRDYLTMASEGVVTIPFGDGVSGGALAVETHFYEFIPENFSETKNAPTLLAQELEVGQRYVVVLTTSAGLYRYILGDVVEVTTFIGSTPVLAFLHRTGHTCSMTGEKLTEDQVTLAVCQAAAEVGLPIHNFTMCPVFKPFPHYALLAEFQLPRGLNLGRLVSQVDVCLGRANVEYKAKRASGRLGAPELHVLPLGTYAKAREQRIAAGVSDAQVKLACLTRDATWLQEFKALSQIQCESPV